MAKMTIDGNVFEGTTEELRAMFDMMGVKFPVQEAEPTPAETKPAQSIEHNGATYTLVTRKAQPGDVVVFTENEYRCLENGKPYEVGNGVRITDCEGDSATVYNRINGRTEANTLVYAPKEQPLQVGDYAKVVRDNTAYNMLYSSGEIVQIVTSDGGKIPYEANGLDSKGTRWFRKDDLAPASDVEVAGAKAAAVFTKLGRKPNEFRKGDIVEIVRFQHGHHEGALVEVTNVSQGVLSVRGVKNGELTSYGADNYAVKLVAPFESRVDTP